MSLSTMTLTSEQLAGFHDYLVEYSNSSNPASGSRLDANANITQKTIATAELELLKPVIVQINRSMMTNKISELYGSAMAEHYLDDISSHRMYVHDETSMKPYCASISMYPFLLSGMTKLGGESLAPKHLLSFCGSFINLVLATSNQFAGAVATVEFLTYFDYFARKELGEDYADELFRDSTERNVIKNALQHVVYALNQPVTRGDQAVFWNISLFDEMYFEQMFGHFVFPDGTKPQWPSLAALQQFFLRWFTKERTQATLTFPVVTAAMLVDKNGPIDKSFELMAAQEMQRGASFFIYMSESADSLASCCRLRNELSSNEFSYSLGAGGVMTGSINVITVNLNCVTQEGSDLEALLERIYAYQMGYRLIIQDHMDAGLLTAYNAGLIDLNKQFLTIGINGMLEAAESQGIQAKNTHAYRNFCDSILHQIYSSNRLAEQRIKVDPRFADKKLTIRFNTEFVPAENLGVKNAKWDKERGFKVFRDCYNSYFYAVEDTEMSLLDKFSLYDKGMVKHLDGGSALHLNLTEHPSAEQWLKIFRIAASKGVQYWTYNVPSTRCRDCNTRDIRFLHECPSDTCDSTNVAHSTRIIGYLKEVDSYSLARQVEHSVRSYGQVPA